MGRVRRQSAVADADADEMEPPPTPLAASGDEASTNAGANADGAWAESLRDVMRQVIGSLPDHANLGDLVAAARSNPAIAPVLDIFTVSELIETAKKKPKPKPAPKQAEPGGDTDGMPALELDAGPRVIRRRADVPDGDLRVLKSLSTQGPLKESELVSATELTSEQLRIIVRHLRTKGFIHIEGSGAKRRVKITRNGGGYLRKHS